MGKRVRAGTNLYYGYAQPPLQRSYGWLVALLVAIGLIAAAAWWFWRSPDDWARVVDTVQQATGQRNDGAPPADIDTAALPDPDATDEAPAIDVLALEPIEPVNPIEPPGDAALAPLPTLDASDPVVTQVFTALGGNLAIGNLLRNDQFVRRLVATVDNLPSPRASTTQWPVHPTHPQFTVNQEGGTADTIIATENSARYAPAVAIAEQLDIAELARQYRHFYPLFQQAYEDLGYPNRYFNDRLVAVIDHLLQAPEPLAPRVRLLPVRGSVAPEQPWVRYEFEDPALEALSAGQKILVRVGPENARRLKQQLRAFRAEIVGQTASATAAED